MRILTAVVGALLAGPIGAQTPSAGQRGVPVTGTVFDSLARKPLALASVQLLAADSANAIPQTTVADSQGHFSFRDVARGRYLIGFFHPLLDSLTIQPILRELFVGGVPIRADLSTPSGSRLRTAFCGKGSGARSPAALVGVVRDARDGSLVAGAPVIAEWTDLVLGGGQMQPRAAGMTAVTGANGWFALCGIPSPGTLTLSASHGADSTDRVDLQVSAEGFARRELYVGASRPGSPRTGDGRVSGRVRNSRLEPLEGAQVSIAGGPKTTANATGEWTLSGTPSGTRMLEVRAIGYYPERRAVDITPDAPAVSFTLATFESVLDTVRIRANAPAELWSGFEDRRRSSGSGRFMTEEDIRRRAPHAATDLFQYIPGMRVAGGDIRMRGAFAGFGDTGDCVPALFVDGKFASTRPDDIDMWVNPSEIKGIEVYFDAPPPQFQAPLSGCGSIVIWTKRVAGRR